MQISKIIRCGLIVTLPALMLATSSAQSSGVEAEIPLVSRRAAWTPGSESTSAMAFDDQTGKLAIGFRDGSVRWWSEKGVAIDKTWPKVTSAVAALAVGSQGQHIAVATSSDVAIFERSSQKLRATVPVTEPVKGLVFSGHEELLAIGNDQECLILKAADGQVLHKAAVVSPFKVAVFADQDQTLIIADKENKHTVVDLKNLQEPKSSRQGYYQMPANGQKGRYLPITDLAVSGDQRALGVVLPPGRLLAHGENRIAWSTRQIVTLKNWNYLNARLSQDGRYALCLMSATPRAVPKGYIWDLVENRQTAKLDKVPNQIQSIAFSSNQALVALRSEAGEVSVWDLKTAFQSPKAPAYLLGTTVKLRNPSDPAAPVSHKDLLVERVEQPNAPAYFQQDAWKVSPYGSGTHLNLLQVSRDTTCLFVLPYPATPETFNDYHRITAFILEKEAWSDGGPCPWQPNSRLWIHPVSAGRKGVPVGSLPLNWAGAQLLFVGNHSILNPEHLKQLPLQTQRGLFERQVRRLFLAGEFSAIEKIAINARSKNEMFGWGYPKLNSVYAGMLPREYQLTPAKCQELATAYVKAEPNSLTARYVLARSLISLGWSYRGTEFAQYVVPENAQQFTKLLESAARMLQQNSAKFAKDPAVEQGLLRALPGGNLTADAVNDLILKGLKKDPNNLETITSGVAFLLPRWTGQPRAAVELTERIRQQHPGKVGRALCAKVALDLFSFEPERWQDLYEFDAAQFELDWEAYYELQREDHVQTTRAGQILAMYGSLPKARTLWEKLGIDASPGAAGGTRELLEWTEQLQDNKHPALLWSRIGKGSGRLMLTPDGEHLLAISQVGRMNFCNTVTGELVGQDVAKFFYAMDGVLPRQGLAILATESGILHFDNDAGVRQVAYPAGVRSLRGKFAPDGSRLLIVDINASLHLINPETGESLATLPTQVPLSERRSPTGSDIGAEFAISPDQKSAAVSVSQNPIRLIQLADGKLLATFPAGTEVPVGSLCFDESGKNLWLARGDHVQNWNIATRSQVGELPPVKRIPSNLVASPDGRFLAMVQNAYHPYSSAEVVLLDRKSPQPAWRRLPLMHADTRLLWHPTQPWLVTYSASGILRVWDVTKF